MKRFCSRLSIALVLATMVAFLSGSALADKPNTLERGKIPEKYKWDLSDIYPSWEAWEEGMAQLEALMDEYAGLKGTLSQGPDALLKAFKLSDELGMLLYKVFRYPQLSYSVDQRNNEVAAHLQQVQILYAKFNTATAWFDPELLSIPWETMKQWLDETPDLAPYRYNIENLYRQQEHVLDEQQEELLSYFSRFDGSPGTIFSQLSTADIEYPTITLPDGDSVTVTPGEYYRILSTDRRQEDRAAAHRAFYGVYDDKANTYAAIYDAVLQRDWALAQSRKYGSTLEAALDDDNVPVEVFENLVSMVKAGTGPYRRYMQLRKEKLGLEEYHLYDGSIPLVDFDKTYPYDEIIAWIVASVAPLGQNYQKKMENVFANRCIDVYENEGKSTGAYSAGVYGVHPYMLMNYNETLENVFTLGHECGHTMHTVLSQENQPFSTSDYTIFVAEVASTLNEALLLDYIMARTEDPVERIALLQRAIDSITGTFYTQVMFAEFEWRAHQLVEQGQPITAEVLSGLYTGLLKEYYGDVISLEGDLYRSTWARISHFYASPYYVYKYATCFASSAKIYKDILSIKDRKAKQAAVDRYLTLLKSGGSDYPMELLRKAGVDLTDPSNFQAVIDQLDGLVSQLATELARL
jgi:oligoendopeptidase F